MNQKTPTINDVQKEVGFIKTHENGIIEQAIAQSSISELLTMYGRIADFRLTFEYGYRHILNLFYEDKTIDTDNIILALMGAIESDAYNIQTILSTMNIDYDPISNININEQIVTSSTINANKIYGEFSTSKNISEITKTVDDTINSGKQKETVNETISDNKGAYSESNNQTENLGKIERAVQDLSTIGAQVNSSTNTLTHAPYNTNSYSAKDQTNINENLGEQINNTNTTDQTNPIENKLTGSKNITARQDNITRNNTINKDSFVDTKTSNITQNPYTENTDTAQRNDTEDSKNNENKDRQLKGLQGKSAQELLLIQRELANVDIVKCLCNLAINTIAQGFIKAW